MINDRFLIDFIQKLNLSEIKYFKIHASENTKYIQLFNLFFSAKTNRKLFNKKLNKYKVADKNYSKTKNYLYHEIIRSLQKQNDKQTSKILIKTKIKEAQILANKGFFESAIQVINRTKRLIEKIQNPLLKLEILHIELSISTKIRHSKANNKRSIQLIKTIEQESKILLDTNKLRLLYNQIALNSNLKGEPLRSSEIEQLINNPILKDESKIIGFDGKSFFYSIYAHYNFIKRNRETESMYWIKLLNLMKQYPTIAQEQHNRYITVLANLVNLLNHLRDNINAIFYINEMLKYSDTNVPESDYQSKAIIFEISTQQTLVYYIHTMKIIEGTRYIESRDIEFKKYPHEVDSIRRIATYFEIAYIYFINEDYELASEWLEKILKHKQINTRQDIFGIARILQIIIHYELGNKRLIHHLTSSTNYFFKKNKILQPFEAIMLKYLRKLSNALPQAENNIFTSLKKELNTKAKESLKYLDMDYFDFSNWIESKIENKAFEKMLREKLKK